MNGIDFIEKTAILGLSLQLDNGEMPSGHNGPYIELETPVRNTGHWCIIFARAFALTGNEKYKVGVEKSAEYLISKDSRPNNYAFWHRDFKGTDKCNGVVGAAWTIEALCEASEVLNDDKYYIIAEEVFLQHKFNKKTGVWHRLEIDGKIGRIDQTFNHQLWFAACASFLLKNKTENTLLIKNRIETFMNQLPNNLALFHDGLIYHPIIRKLDTRSVLSDMYSLFREGIETLLKKNVSKKMKIERFSKLYWKSVGYHSFNTFAFALLKSNVNDHKFWDSKLNKRLINYIMTDNYKSLLKIEDYFGFPYNPPGFEVPYSLEKLSDLNAEELINTCQYWVSKQLKYSYNFESGMMDKNNEDVNTMSARIYELVRLNEEILFQLKL